MDSNVSPPAEGAAATRKPSETLAEIISAWSDDAVVKNEASTKLNAWLTANITHVNEASEKEIARHNKLQKLCAIAGRRVEVRTTLRSRVPIFVLFSNYFRVRPIIHLEHLARRIEQNLLDDVQYDYGNICLLKLLGFTARELSNLGKVVEPPASDAAAMKAYRDQLDKRQYQLNAASVRLTEEIRS